MSNDIRNQVETLSSTKPQISKDHEKTRIKRDEEDVEKIRNQFERFKPFIRNGTSLVCISTNDAASERIQDFHQCRCKQSQPDQVFDEGSPFTSIRNYQLTKKWLSLVETLTLRSCCFMPRQSRTSPESSGGGRHTSDSPCQGCSTGRFPQNNVLGLFIHHEVAAQVWVDAGTMKKPRFIPVHLMQESLKPEIRENILSFHLITGCNSTNQF
ncbi:hypothetical protein SK128_004339 [Halocaridina rubra]|uniref:Uncharacterized protein n=1 Tax=Halocaridina rubra TaxID=373956 RepID=A0AAN8WUH6_HALRR